VAERARANLARYFSPNLVDLLADRDEPLGPVRRETVAVLFADIVGFTRMAERMAPEAVVTMLREFQERMTAEIFACGGTVEKYIGDAILAVFGLLHASAQDAANALRCADRMLSALDQWNREREWQDEPPLAVGIGLNYGPAVIGDVGCKQGLLFTVIGDTVNTASRLQSLTRGLRTSLVASDGLVTATRDGAADDLLVILARLEDRGEKNLQGRIEPVRVWIGPSTI
jgi:adenylate cyclase